MERDLIPLGMKEGKVAEKGRVVEVTNFNATQTLCDVT
jgi:hypothetical protein